jgi:arylsulfatase A-like enzyme
MTLFGQAALTARRLVEAGGRFITVFWDEYGLAGTGWDTHWDHFPRMKDELLPGLDLTLSGLLIDLDQRGLLDETLVVLLSEHGRTPKLASVQGGGRDHWSRCYSVVMAGGGIKRGCVLGKSDKIASDPLERRVSPKDILATIYHLLGIDPATTLTDQQGRPMVLAPEAEVITDVLA